MESVPKRKDEKGGDGMGKRILNAGLAGAIALGVTADSKELPAKGVEGSQLSQKQSDELGEMIHGDVRDFLAEHKGDIGTHNLELVSGDWSNGKGITVLQFKIDDRTRAMVYDRGDGFKDSLHHFLMAEGVMPKYISPQEHN